MPFCPDCHYEFRDGVKTCPECKVDLTAEPESEHIPLNLNFEEIYMVSNRMEAEVISSLLNENEVIHLIRDLRVFPVLPDFGRRARLRVAVQSEKLDLAKRLLHEAREDGVLTDQGRFL